MKTKLKDWDTKETPQFWGKKGFYVWLRWKSPLLKVTDEKEWISEIHNKLWNVWLKTQLLQISALNPTQGFSDVV